MGHSQQNKKKEKKIKKLGVSGLCTIIEMRILLFTLLYYVYSLDVRIVLERPVLLWMECPGGGKLFDSRASIVL